MTPDKLQLLTSSFVLQLSHSTILTNPFYIGVNILLIALEFSCISQGNPPREINKVSIFLTI